MTWNMVGMIAITLLKIIGILLLVILLLLVLVLFAPLCYRVKSTVFEEKQVCGRVSWLGIVARLVFQWQDGDVHWKLQVFGIPVLKSHRKKKVHSRLRLSDSKKTRKKKVEPEEKKHKEQKQQKQQKEYTEQKENKQHKQSEVAQNKKKSDEAQAANETGDQPGRVVRLWKRMKELIPGIRRMLRMVRSKVHSIQDLAELLREEYTKRFICIAKDNMLHLWKQLRPRKICGNIRFGTGDPCSTGQILGVIGVFYGWIGSGLQITPDFEQQCFEGTIEMKGRICVITLVVIVVKIMLNKDFMQLQGEWKRWKEDF